MQRSHTTRFRIAAALAAACVGLAVASTAAAVDLRSWDLKINDVNKRFIVLPAFNNQAVLDKETQLVWQRSPDSTLWGYAGADYTGCAINPIGGRLGWRLPSRFELMSLLDPSATGPVKLPAGHPFLGVQPDNYWTNNRAPNPDPAYDMFKVAVHAGAALQVVIHVGNVSIQNRAWCVRGPSAE